MKIIPLERALEEFSLKDAAAPFVIPTETVYGLAAPIDNDVMLRRIYEIKGRPSDNPLIVHISSAEMLSELIDGSVPVEYAKLMDAFWPGPLTLVFKAHSSVSHVVMGQGKDTVAVRMPRNKMLRDLIEKLGVPLAAPSANTSGKPSPTTVEHAVADLKEKVSIYIDGGPASIGLESTVVGLLGTEVVLLRPGGVTREAIENVLGHKIKLKCSVSDGETVISPGQKYKHYSPTVPFYLFLGSGWQSAMAREAEQFKGKRLGVLCSTSDELTIAVHERYDLGDDKREWSSNIFSGLIYLDKRCDVIFGHSVDIGDEGLAIMDRLTKAATQIIDK